MFHATDKHEYSIQTLGLQEEFLYLKIGNVLILKKEAALD